MQFKLARPIRPVDAVAHALRRSILSGEAKAGSFLPPERELAEALKVSRLTLRAALARLEAEGLVQPKQGEGVLVLPITMGANLSILPYLVDETADPDPSLIRSFLELRRAVAVEALALAAARISKRSLRKIESLVELQLNECSDEEYGERDLAISRALLEASENVAMLLLLNSVEAAYRARPDLMHALGADRTRSRAGYALMLHILRTKDAAMAREKVPPLLEAIDEEALKALRRAKLNSVSKTIGRRRR